MFDPNLAPQLPLEGGFLRSVRGIEIPDLPACLGIPGRVASATGPRYLKAEDVHRLAMEYASEYEQYCVMKTPGRSSLPAGQLQSIAARAAQFLGNLRRNRVVRLPATTVQGLWYQRQDETRRREMDRQGANIAHSQAMPDPLLHQGRIVFWTKDIQLLAGPQSTTIYPSKGNKRCVAFLLMLHLSITVHRIWW